MKTKKRLRFRSIVVLSAVVFIIFVGIQIIDIRVTPNARFLSLLQTLTLRPVPIPEPTAENLTAAVAPESGYTVSIVWGDTGKKLIQAGGIDMEKYVGVYTDEAQKKLLTYLTDTKKDGITINKDTAYFWVNTLWALGLTQKSDVLEKGIMGTKYEKDIGSFASTGGWTLGKRDAVSLYSSADIIPLTEKQQAVVDAISQHVYRPCCGNPTSFPDCNHGMAILGLIELMVSQGFSEGEIYKAALAFNSYWFTSTYVDLAYYFQTKEGIVWSDVDAKRVLSAEFSSAPGYSAIKKQIGTVPGAPQIGASCGA